MDKNNIPEEETLTPVIKDIERIVIRILYAVGKGFSAIGSILKSIFLFLIINIKKLALIAILGAILGYFSFSIAPKEYASSMVVKLNIDAKEQLISDINYFNSLLKRDQFDKIGSLLNLTIDEAKSITEFEVIPYSSLKERIEYVNTVFKNLDTSYQRYIKIDEILEDGENSYSNKNMIIIKSSNEFIFEKIEAPFLAYLERVPELNHMRKNILSILENERTILIKEMESLDTLKKITNSVMLEQAKASNKTTTGTIINLDRQSKESTINPMDVYAKMIDYSKEVSKIDALIANYSSCYIIYSHFNTIGYKVGLGKLGRMAFFSLSFFALAALLIAIKRAMPAI